jgi:uncharacterized HAD superfamily protein
MKTTPITQYQADFITANYKTMSMKDITEYLNIPIPRLRKYMESNELTVSKEEIQAIKTANYLKNKEKIQKSKSGKYIPFQWMPY